MLAYEELKGSTGREIWYRPPRYEARKLFPNSPPRVRVRDNTYQLHNISLGGVAAVAKNTDEERLEVGEIVLFSLQQSGLPIFESSARVCRAENTMFGSKIAFNFFDRFIELDKLILRNTQAQIATRLSRLGCETSQIVPREYRSFCSDVLQLLRGYRSALESNTLIARQFAAEFDNNGAFEACEERLLQQWRSLWRTGNDIVKGMINDREVREASKEFTELVLTPEMRLGAIWDRSYAKPLGYPGDFEIMNQVYDWKRVGNNAYEMLLHRLGLDVAECIQTRMETVRTHISEVARTKGVDQPARILSLGSGPVREVETFVSNPINQKWHTTFTLIDQEDAALRYAYEKTYPHVLNAHGRLKIQCLNMSFTDILRGTSGLSHLPPQDLIYSVGLLDYLTERRSTSLVRRLYQQLRPGGMLIIGNMNETSLSNFWPLEFITDWTLAYRNEAQMLAWAEGLPAAKVWTETEPTERVRLLFICKP